MTKSLTEQWKDGTLDYGWYYIKVYWGAGYDVVFDNYNATTREFVDFDKKAIKEVLAPVPSYEEFVQQREFVKDHQKVLIKNMNLKQQLDELQTEKNNLLNDIVDLNLTIENRDKQLAEANEVIQLNTYAGRFTLDITTDRFGNERRTFKPSDVYCRKYGLKYGWDYEPQQDCFVRWGAK